MNSFDIAVKVRKDHGHVAAEFPDDLTADAAGRSEFFRIDNDRNALKMFFTTRDTLPDSHAFGTNG